MKKMKPNPFKKSVHGKTRVVAIKLVFREGLKHKYGKEPEDEEDITSQVEQTLIDELKEKIIDLLFEDDYVLLDSVNDEYGTKFELEDVLKNVKVDEI